MAVLMILDSHGVSKDDYERLNATMGVRSDADAPEGLIGHTAAVTDDGDLIIVDVWESEEALGRFVDTRLGPALSKLGLPAPEPRVLPVHNRLRGSGDANTLFVLEVANFSTEAYDAMTREMPAHQSPGAHPVHEHVAATDGNTIVVADLWTSPEAFQQFAQSQMAPIAERHGMDLGAMRQRLAHVVNRIRGRERVQA